MVEIMPLPNETVTSLAMALVEFVEGAAAPAR